MASQRGIAVRRIPGDAKRDGGNIWPALGSAVDVDLDHRAASGLSLRGSCAGKSRKPHGQKKRDAPHR
jgi:hypothetical protein